MTAPVELHEQSAAESAPIVRRTAKFITGVSAFALWVAAIWMSISAMLALSAGEPIYVVTGVIALALACDLWVGSAPIVLRSASAWGLRKWAWVGVVTLILALGMTTWNKISFWEGRSAQAEVRALQLGADPASAARELVAANAYSRVPDAVQGELDGALARRDAKRLEIGALSDSQENELRRRRSIRELGGIETEIGKLRAELASAKALAAARLEVAAADAQALELLQVGATKPPQPLWLHVALAIVHEALQLVMLSFATLRIPGAVLDAEVQRIILARKIKLSRRVEMVKLSLDEVRQLKTAKVVFDQTKKRLPTIARRRANLEADREEFDIELEEKKFSDYKLTMLGDKPFPIPEKMRIEDKRGVPAKPPVEVLYKTTIRDQDSANDLDFQSGRIVDVARQTDGVRTGTFVPHEIILPDEQGLSLPVDPRLPPVPAPEPIEATIPEQAATPPTIEAILERGRSGELLSDEEIAALAQAGAVEQGPDGAWREIASAPQ